MKSCLLIVLVLAGLMWQGWALQKTAVLSLEDGQKEEIYVRLQAGKFRVYIYNSHFATDPVTYFCFRERTVQQGRNNKCSLQNLLGSYTCIEAIGTFTNGALTVSANSYQSDYTLTSTVKTNATAISSASISVGISQASIDISSFLTDNKIYQVYAGYVINLRAGSVFTKNAFFHTFRLSTQTTSDDLMMPRNPHCFEFYHLQLISINVVFYGGVIRGGNSTMFVSVLSFFYDSTFTNIVTTNVNLNGWIGFSFSKSHATRDMIAFILSNSTIFDLYSLYYSAPYLDESIHVEGTSDILQIADSAAHTGGNNTHYFYGGIARMYDTGDNFGDEIIRKKMNNTYCYAISFLDQNNSVSHSPLIASNKHDDYECFTSFVTLWEPNLLISFVIALIFMII